MKQGNLFDNNEAASTCAKVKAQKPCTKAGKQNLCKADVSRETSATSIEKRNIPEYTVSQISQLIKGILENQFSNITVKGEISEITYPKSGHVYFTIKDESAALSVICWRHVFQKLKIKLDIGIEVVCKGKISSYPARSNYQFILTDIEISGDGTLLKLFQERKAKLEKMGIFAAEHKLPIPQFPNSICVITSASGAVIKDITHRISARYPLHMYIYHCQVQGVEAHLEVIKAIQNLNKWRLAKNDSTNLNDSVSPDLIIIARGGGSAQDLWPFNEEELALAIYHSKIPIISAVGHETDFTLCDLASDLRAPTPTAAAELAVPNRYEIIRHNNNLFSRLQTKILNFIQIYGYQFSNLCKCFIKHLHKLEMQISQIDNIYNSLIYVVINKMNHCRNSAITLNANLMFKYFRVGEHAMHNYLTAKGAMLKKLEQAEIKVQSSFRVLENLHPQRVLNRGYALVRQNNVVVTSKQAFKKNVHKQTTLQFKDGVVDL